MQRLRTVISLSLIALMAGCNPSTRVKQKQAMTIDKNTAMAGLKRRIGVVDFQNKTTYGANRLGTSASDILITELAKSNRFIVVERDKLDKLMEEQKLGMSGAVDPNTAAKMGKIL